MDKKDIYEHLAKIYLDASSNSKRKKRGKDYSKALRNLFFVGILFAAGLGGVLLSTTFKAGRPANSEIALILLPEAAKINFHFDPAKKETFTINLNELDLNHFRTLAFSARKANYRDNISLRVEFVSAYKEKSEVYFKDIPHKWQEYKISLPDFRGIADWSQMRSLVFVVEEWNAREKRGMVYLDNVRLLK